MRAALIVALLLLAGPAARAEGDRAGDFAYYILALSWSPSFCAREGRAEGNPQCDRPLGWVLHGLWPQHEEGWPERCRAATRDPTRAETAAMADIMGTGGLAWHQWQKHGRCSGLPAREYFALSRRAFDAVEKPEVLEQLDRPVDLPARVVEDAFLEANPGWTADMLTITCRDGRIAEARLCLTKDLRPRPCGADVARDCRMDDARLDPVR